MNASTRAIIDTSTFCAKLCGTDSHPLIAVVVFSSDTIYVSWTLDLSSWIPNANARVLSQLYLACFKRHQAGCSLTKIEGFSSHPFVL